MATPNICWVPHLPLQQEGKQQKDQSRERRATELMLSHRCSSLGQPAAWESEHEVGSGTRPGGAASTLLVSTTPTRGHLRKPLWGRGGAAPTY